MGNSKQPKIRFSEFIRNWEEKKFIEIVNRVSKQSNANNLPKVEFEDIISGEGKLNKDISNKYDDRKGTVFEPNYILYGKLRPYLKNWLLTNFSGVALGDFWVFEPKDSAAYVYYLIQTEKYQIAANLSSGTKMPRSDWKTVSETTFYIPFIEEQNKIGEFFTQLDETISLQQQELDTLKQTKQGFLQKMFPKEGESVPDLRFPGFASEWKLSSLDSLVDRVKSYSLSRAVETKENTRYKYIHYGDIHTNVANIVDEYSNLPNIQGGNYELLKKGDLVLADASEDYKGIATPALINIETPYNLVAGLHTIALRPKIEEVDSLFLYYLIKSPIFKRYGYKVGTGMKVFGISITNLLKFENLFPTVEEQKEIGVFLKNLDKVIALHQQELDALKQTKKAFLQKMFV